MSGGRQLLRAAARPAARLEISAAPVAQSAASPMDGGAEFGAAIAEATRSTLRAAGALRASAASSQRAATLAADVAPGALVALTAAAAAASDFAAVLGLLSNQAASLQTGADAAPEPQRAQPAEAQPARRADETAREFLEREVRRRCPLQRVAYTTRWHRAAKIGDPTYIGEASISGGGGCWEGVFCHTAADAEESAAETAAAGFAGQGASA